MLSKGDLTTGAWLYYLTLCLTPSARLSNQVHSSWSSVVDWLVLLSFLWCSRFCDAFARLLLMPPWVHPFAPCKTKVIVIVNKMWVSNTSLFLLFLFRFITHSIGISDVVNELLWILEIVPFLSIYSWEIYGFHIIEVLTTVWQSKINYTFKKQNFWILPDMSEIFCGPHRPLSMSVVGLLSCSFMTVCRYCEKLWGLQCHLVGKAWKSKSFEQRCLQHELNHEHFMYTIHV